jgi:hypothetical protein
MKKTSPMQMKKAASSKGMQAYADKRNSGSAAAKKAPATKKAAAASPVIAAPSMKADNYDAQYDLDTLTRAAAIKADSRRHAAAMNEAKKKQAQLKNVMGKV